MMPNNNNYNMTCILLMLVVFYCGLSIAEKSNSSMNTSLLTYGRLIYQYTHRVKWLCFNTLEDYDCCRMKGVSCLESGPVLQLGNCATYSENNSTKSLSLSKCPYLQTNINYNITTPGYISLPVNLTELNNYMCGPLNRKSLVCSECADGFGPSVTSYGFKCANCTNAWYHIPLFLFVQFVPITVLYIIILVFRISVTTPPMPCFILCSQFIAYGFNIYTDKSHNYSRKLLFSEDGDIRLDIKIIQTFYGLFNQLDIFQYVLPPLCLSSKLKQIHVVFLGYISVFYSILLIFLTWVCVNLHDNNFRPVVLLWKPFHKCFIQLRREWDIKNDLVDTFITFFLLSYTKSIYQALVMLNNKGIKTFDQWGNKSIRFQSSIDPTVNLHDNTHLPLFVILSLFLFLFNILPPLLLILYPFGAFRSCLSKCRLDFIAVNIFADKIHSCYRNGLDGGRDMRSLSGLFFCSVMGIVMITSISAVLGGNIWFSGGLAALFTANIVAMTKPYQNMYMNNLDSLLLSCIAVQCFATASHFFQIARLFLVIPIFVFILTITLKVIKQFKRCSCDIQALLQKCCYSIVCRLRRFQANTEHTHTLDTESYSPTVAQPLIQPTTSEISYGTI